MGDCRSAPGCRYLRFLLAPKELHMPRFIHRTAEETGQTMAEYGVVLALITLAVLASLTLLSDNISSAFTSVANLLP
jgi:Flp pilus assembly pilin Flp